MWICNLRLMCACVCVCVCSFFEMECVVRFLVRYGGNRLGIYYEFVNREFPSSIRSDDKKFLLIVFM